MARPLPCIFTLTRPSKASSALTACYRKKGTRGAGQNKQTSAAGASETCARTTLIHQKYALPHITLSPFHAISHAPHAKLCPSHASTCTHTPPHTHPHIHPHPNTHIHTHTHTHTHIHPHTHPHRTCRVPRCASSALTTASRRKISSGRAPSRGGGMATSS